MSELTNLANKLDKFAKSLPEQASGIGRKAANAAIFDLGQATPADVGEAISNWQVSVGAPITTPIDAFAPSPKGRMKNGVWTHAVDPAITREANAPIMEAAAKVALEAKRPAEPIYITNNTPQIVPLNQGSSTQEPQGFVDRALIVARNVIEKIRLVL